MNRFHVLRPAAAAVAASLLLAACSGQPDVRPSPSSPPAPEPVPSEPSAPPATWPSSRLTYSSEYPRSTGRPGAEPCPDLTEADRSGSGRPVPVQLKVGERRTFCLGVVGGHPGAWIIHEHPRASVVGARVRLDPLALPPDPEDPADKPVGGSSDNAMLDLGGLGAGRTRVTVHLCETQSCDGYHLWAVKRFDVVVR